MGSFALAAAIFVMMTAWFGGQVYEVRPPNQTTLQSTFEKLQEWASGHMPEDNEAIPAGTTGYSTNDGELGAPLSRNTEPVFTALTSQRTYWRGESIAYYDGRRWIRGGEEFTPLNLSSLPQIPATVTTTNGGGLCNSGYNLLFPLPVEFLYSMRVP